jgi:FtsP/CotA-like multicopper oxidase with cupredoxin domain
MHEQFSLHAKLSPKSLPFTAGLLTLFLLAPAGLAAAAEAPQRPQFREPPVAELVAPATAAEDRGQVVHLTAARQPTGDKLCLTYSGQRPGPTIHMHPGGRQDVFLENRLKGFTAAELMQFNPPVLRSGEPPEVADLVAASSAITNLHTHGLHVSPRGRSDNVLLRVNSGRTNYFSFALPPDHAPGTHWYHAHLHGSTALQVQGGMSGALIVEPPQGQELDPPGFRVREHIVVMQVDCTTPPADPAIKETATLGDVRPLTETLPERLRGIAGAKSEEELDRLIDALGEADQRLLAERLGKLPADPPRFIVNRLSDPELEVAVGEYRRLRLINSGSRRDDYKEIWIPDVDIYLAAFDGVNLTHLPTVSPGQYVAYNEANPLVLAPGNRADVYFSTFAVGEHALMMRGETRVRLTDESELRQPFTQRLMTFVVAKAAAQEGAETPQAAATEADMQRFLEALDANLVRLQGTTPYRTYLRRFSAEPAVKREMTFNIVGTGRTRGFTINGRSYNAAVDGHMQGLTDYLGKVPGDGGRGPAGQTPWPPRTGTEETWTITNPSTQKHPFHIHVSPFWVHDVVENGQSVRATDPNDPRINRWQDVITLPAKVGSNAGSVTIWHRFSDFEGVFVVHCHILQHEDRGMMINILLSPKDNPDPAGYFQREMTTNCEINNQINGTRCPCPAGCPH